MKRTILAALAATMLATGVGAAAANAQPFHHGPVVYRGPVFRGGPVRFGGPGFVTVGYHRWGYGAYVPRAWLVPARFVVDFGYYNLAPPPPNFEWVQDGPDALLVNLSTGMVVQVVPGAFA